ncbi:hypothetical protein DPEC_G00357560 [Dallia pectoralis]|uniref:Uncharacterized protein n=1 Tax=Dallia pectoralis TaxID=75939 RepID=A0ACC2F040_DALPE|nr:hypothetical protein DPEC_G00357560 [Dallia pectoralis]
MAYHGHVQDFVAISDLHPNTTHPRVAGVIIGKTDVKSFPDRKKIGFDRFTFSFTIKDSPDYFINVYSWGNDGYINGLSNSFSIGDCVIIENPLVATKDSEKEDRFCPSTPSFYRLLVSEAHSQLSICADIEIMNRLLPLLHLPVKDYRDFYSLGDIMANGQSLDGNVINILAVVRSVAEAKYFTTADGRKGQRLDVKLFDDSVTSFPLVCWDREAIQLVQALIPRETVLFISDARISYDSFRNCMTATVNSKTIITVNPDTKEASLLFSYAKEVSQSGVLGVDDTLGDVPVEFISDVYTVSQLKRKAQENPKVFCGITYSFISRLDLDSSIAKVIKSRCSKCKYQVKEESQSCSNDACPGGDQPLAVTTGFDLLVDVTDHTGTLQSCSLNGTVAEKMLGCSHIEFANLAEDERTAMKWKILLERCKVFFKITPSSKTRSGMRLKYYRSWSDIKQQSRMNVNQGQGTVGSDPVILATAGYDHTVRFWQAHSGICTRTVQHQDSQVNSLEVTPDRSMIAAAGYQHIRMYDLNSNNPNPVINYDGVSKNITSVGFHEDGRWMYTGGEDCMARIWDLRSRNLQCQRIFQVNAPINCVCLHPNQAELIVGDQSGVIHIWDLKTDNNEQLIPEPDVSINSVHIDPDASYMAAVNSSGNCYVWNLAGGMGDEVTQLIPKTKIPAHKRYSLRCRFSPDSTLLATCSADQTCKIWRTSNFSLMTELSIKSNNPGETSRGWMWDCAFSGDSQYIVTASSDNLARLWCVETGEIKREYSGHQKAVVCLAFNDSVLG